MVKKRMVIAAGLYPPDIGGPATYVRMLEEELPKRGYELSVLPFGTVRHLPKIVRHIAYVWQLYKMSKNTDYIYALDGFSVGLPALLVSRLRRKFFLVRLGGDYAWEQGRLRFGITSNLDEFTADPSRRPLRVRFLAWIQTFVVRRARLVIAPSQYLKNIILTWGVKDKQVKVVHSALFPLPVNEKRDSIRTQLGYEGLVLITAARLTPWKGVAGVIDVVAVLKEHGVSAMLIVAGDGESRVELEQKVQQLGLSDQVRFIGKVSKEALGAAIKGADIFVYNTSYEGLPHQLLEVMDLGVPVITTDIPGNREVISDGVEGILVSPNDVPALTAAVVRLRDNPQQRQRLVQNAHLRAKNFAQARVVDELVTILEQL